MQIPMPSFPFLIALSALAVASPSAGQEPVTVTGPAMKVAYASFAGLDLARSSDRRILHRRIVDAAGEVCLDTAIDPLMLDGDREHCWRSAIRAGDRAAADLAAGRLAASSSQTLAILAR